MSIFDKTFLTNRDRTNKDRIAANALTALTHRGADSTSFSLNSVGAVALDTKSTLRNGDPSGDSIATASSEFSAINQETINRETISDLISDEFISDNLLDECTIDTNDTNSHKRPAGVLRLFAEWTIGFEQAFPWLRGSSICAFPSWRAEGLARIIFPASLLVAAVLSHTENLSRPWGLHYRPQFL